MTEPKDPKTFDMETTADGQLALVEMLLPGYNFEKRYEPIDKALLGEAQGVWKIIRKGSQRQTYDTRVMVPKVEPISMPLPGDPRQNYETKHVKKKKIAWVEDRWVTGGAELSGAHVARIGEECGFLIERIDHTSDPQFITSVIGRVDAIVLNNIWGFSESQIRAIMQGIYADMVPYVKYEHDHRELGRPDFSRRLFGNSILNVFLSPVHLKNHQEALECDGIALPLAIEVDLFRPNGGERKTSHAIVCNVRNFKTWKILQAYINDHPEIAFTILAEKPIVVVGGKNVFPHPLIQPTEMPGLYSAYEYVVHLLDGWGAGERVVFEGALCGCKIVANEKVGHMSWGKDLTKTDELREWLQQAPFEFWKEIEKRLGT